MPGLYSHTTRATGLVLTASIYNADHQNHIDNHVPLMIDDYSANVTQFRAVTDPGESGSESLPVSLAGELERLRFIIKEITGKTQWYESPSQNLQGLAALSTFATGVTIQYASAAASDFLVLRNTDAGANGPDLIFDLDSATPAVSDRLGEVKWRGNDSALNTTLFASWKCHVLDPVDGSEDGRLSISTIGGGTFADRWYFALGLYEPSLIDKGQGTINALEYYRSGIKGAPCSFAILRHEETSGTAGGSATSGSFFTRPLNVESYDPDGIVSLAANQFTLEAGTYRIRAAVINFRTGVSQLRIQNITDTTTAWLGVFGSSNSGSTDPAAGVTTLDGIFTIAASKVFELQQRVATTRATDGLGQAMSWGTEVYGGVLIEKVG